MSEAVKVQVTGAGRGLIACFVVSLVLLAMGGILGWFDRTTELTPSHDEVLQFCFIIGGLGGLVCGGLSIRESRGMAAWRRVAIGCCLAVVGFLAVFLLSSRSADLITARLDFPAAKTRTYPGLLIIWRAYQTHGKGRSWNIQTTPIWSNLDVTQADYEFMLAHRSPQDQGRNPDEISSHGFFCARVTLQQSGDALRVLNAGNQKLPAGTVVVCPTTPSQPTFPTGP
ncbi:hypothetical protein HDF11_003004 [Tunturiibacter psychrotolerans]